MRRRSAAFHLLQPIELLSATVHSRFFQRLRGLLVQIDEWDVRRKRVILRGVTKCWECMWAGRAWT